MLVHPMMIVMMVMVMLVVVMLPARTGWTMITQKTTLDKYLYSVCFVFQRRALRLKDDDSSRLNHDRLESSFVQ